MCPSWASKTNTFEELYLHLETFGQGLGTGRKIVKC